MAGETAFAAFYPNCRSVFGFDDHSVSEPTNVRYDVLGWYHDPRQDALHQFIHQNSPFLDNECKATKAATLEAIKNKFGWRFALPDGQTSPDRITCLARMTFAGDVASAARSSSPTKTTIAVGNTGSEALAAFVASQIARDNEAVVEDQLKAV